MANHNNSDQDFTRASKDTRLSNKQLCQAVLENDIEMLRYLLAETNVDVNHRDDIKRKTPLQMSHTIEIAKILIKNGADVNIPCDDETNLLTKAVVNYKDTNDLEMICMLLYYDSDISYGCDESPLTNAVYDNHPDIYPFLINYYDDFTNECVLGNYILTLACGNEDPFALDLIKAGASVNCIDEWDGHPFQIALFYDNEELFNLFWERLDKQIHTPSSLLFSFLKNCVYAISRWLKCLYLMLNTPEPFFDEEPHDYALYYGVNNECYFWYALLRELFEKSITLKDRMGLIYTCLQLQIKVDTRILIIVHNFFGFGEELEALLYAGDLTNWDDLRVLSAYILAREDDFSLQQLFERLFIPNRFLNEKVRLKEIISSLGFFSIPYCLKESLRSLNIIHMSGSKEISKKLDEVPEIPSLVELSRSGIRKFIKQNYVIKYPYQFHDIVKGLKLPKYLQDVVRFKTHIY